MNRDPVVLIDEFLLRDDPQLRVNAILALGAIQTAASTDRLISRALDDRVERVRKAAEDELVERVTAGDAYVLKLYDEEKDSRRKREFYALLGRLRAKGAKIPPLSGGWGPALWLFGIAYPERGFKFYFRTLPAALGGAVVVVVLMEIVLGIVTSTAGLNGGISTELTKGVGIGALIGVVLAILASVRSTAWPLHGAGRGQIVEILFSLALAAGSYALLAILFTMVIGESAQKENFIVLGIVLVFAVVAVRTLTIIGGATARSRWTNFLVAAATGAAGSMLLCTALLRWLAILDPDLFSRLWVLVLPACGSLATAFASIDARVPIAWRSRRRAIASGLVIALFIIGLADLTVAAYMTRRARSTLIQRASREVPVKGKIVSASGGGYLEVGMAPYHGQLNIQDTVRVGLAWPGETSVTLAHGTAAVMTSADKIDIVVDRGVYDVYYGLGSASGEKADLTPSEALRITLDAVRRPFRAQQIDLRPEPVTPLTIQVTFADPRNPYAYTNTAAFDTAMTDTISTTDTMATDTSMTMADTSATTVTETTATSATSTTSTTDDPSGTTRRILAQSQLNAGVTHALEGNIPTALADFRAARETDPKLPIPSSAWNTLCWNAALEGYASKVVDEACDYAVSQTPDDYRFKDSRGVAEALTGKYAAAIADFQPYVNAAPDVTRRAQRKAWIETLKKNENPITPEVIKGLLGQSITPGPKP